MSSPAGLARNLRVPRFAEQAAERARLVVVPRVRRRAPRLPFAMLVGLVLLSGVVGLLMFNTSLQRTSFVISERSTQAEGLHAEVQQLRLQLDELRDPRRWASKRCGWGCGHRTLLPSSSSARGW